MVDSTVFPVPDTSLRVVVLSGLPPAVVWRLVSRLNHEAANVHVVGVLLEIRAGKTIPARIRNVATHLTRSGYVSYVGARLTAALLGAASTLGHEWLRHVHAAPRLPNGSPALNAHQLRDRLADSGTDLCVTSDVHAREAIDFVRALRADLGIVYGTRILKPLLFELPRLGSINIHKRKVPDYRGGGPIGLWELLDDQTEIGVTVHRVAAAVDTGEVIRAATIPIEPFDDLTSLGLKADVVGEDLLVQAASDYAAGTVCPTPQAPGGRTYKTPSAMALRGLIRRVNAKRRPFRPSRRRSVWKLLARAVLFGPGAWWDNRRCRRDRAFPVVMLYHHVIADRPHSMGISTAHFARQIRYLARHYRIASLPDALVMLQAGQVDVPTMVLTFDDGYADNLLNVRAVLEPLGLSATFFVCSEHLSTGAPFAHDVGAHDLGFRPMTWDEARMMGDRGFTIASHTRTHFDCGSSDPRRLRQELQGSRTEIEAETGQAIPWFSFPFGRPANMSTVAAGIAKETYPFIFSACYGVNHPGRANGGHFLRCPHPDDLIELELTLQSLLDRDPEGYGLPF